MEFLVGWAGYDESSYTWEPCKALMHVDKLHEYLREHSIDPQRTQVVTVNLFQDFPRHFSNRHWFSP